MRIQKYLASVTSISRRRVEGDIALGKVQINGVKAKLGAFVENGDQLYWNKQNYLVNIVKPELEIISYYKPIGEVCTKYDAIDRPLVYDSLPSCSEGRWISVGRLDINSEGLLVFCNDGDVANKMMHPSANWLRVYKVRVFGKISAEKIKKACHGVYVDGDLCKFISCNVLSEDATGMNKWYLVSVGTGRYRMVRKIWEEIGGKVNKLVRISYGPITLDANLKPGGVKWLSKKELMRIKEEFSHES